MVNIIHDDESLVHEKLTKREIRVLERAIQFAGQHFDMPHDIAIVLTMKEEICINLDKKTNTVATASATNNPKIYFIDFTERFYLYRLIKTIFHEMTHVNQYVTRKLWHHQDGLLWMNMLHPRCMYDHESLSFEAYQALPWEIEARQQEEAIFSKWTEYNKLTNRLRRWWHGLWRQHVKRGMESGTQTTDSRAGGIDCSGRGQTSCAETRSGSAANE